MDFQSSTLSPSSEQIWKYDVFLSFSLEDTSSFVQRLAYALEKERLTLCRCWIDPSKTIEESQIYVVVFSKNYAASTSCLQELTTIAECINAPGHSFLPIFFEVDPSEVPNSYFLERIGKFGLDSDKAVKVQTWLATTTLLTQHQDLVVPHEIDQPRVIEEIVVEAIKKILDYKAFTPRKMMEFNINETVKKVMDKSGHIATVGIRSYRVQKLVKLLDLGSINVVRLVGICGMGGIGKTALAADVFNKISHLFYASCFLTISEYASCFLTISEYNYREYYLKEALLRVTRQEGYVHGMHQNVHNGLRLPRMLIVLDDVDNLGQLEILAGNRAWFGEGSRIIITTRDEQILKMHEVDEIHKVELLNKDEALRLFCKTAFKCDYPMRGYEELTFDALEYANGLPLAIKSLGSLLLDRSVSEWQSELAKLHIIPDSSIFIVLRKSFDGLCKMQKEIFLDIACCFAGEKINYVKEILISQYGLFSAEETIGVLIDKSLVTIVNQRIQMHYMLQQVGREIVRQESTALERRSRLWRYDDFRQVMERNTGTMQVKVIVLLNQEYPQETPLNVEGLSKMSNLRLLIFRNVNFSGRLNCLSNKLLYLSWHKYPFTCLPSNFRPRQLVELIMLDSCITQLWKGKKILLPMLRSLNLRGSKYLLKTPYFGFLPYLERLDFEGCISLLRLDPSVALLPRLKFLNLRNCSSLVSIPNELFGQSSLEFLNLAGCSQFAEFFELQ